MKNNTIELPNAELKNALLGIGKVVGRKTTLPILSTIKVRRNNLGIVSLEGTDLESHVTYTLKEIQSGAPVEFIVPIEPLSKLAKGTKDQLCVRPEGKSAIIQTFIGSTALDHTVDSFDLKEWPACPGMPINGVILDHNFRATYLEALECSSTDSTRYVLNGVYLDVDDPKGHYVVSTNSRILFSANSFTFQFKESLLIPNRKFLGWNGWWTKGDGMLSIRVPDKEHEAGWIKITADQWSFVTKGICGNYPKWKVAVPNEEPKARVHIPEDTSDSVLQVLARIPGDDQPSQDVRLNISGTTLVLQGRQMGQEQFASVPIVNAEVTGEPIVVTLDRRFLAKALKFGLNTIDVVDEARPVTCKAGGRKMVIMPLLYDHVPAKGKAPATPHEPAAATTPTAESTPPTETTTTPAPTPEPVTTEERTTMPKQTSVPKEEQQDTPLKQLVQQLESIKNNLKTVLGELAAAVDVVKRAEKEKKQSDKEIEAIRAKLREIQSVSI